MQAETSSKRPRTPTSDSQRERDAEEEEQDAPAQELDEHYVTMRTDVVGIQYYNGLVGKGEYVMLRRQPENQYDANAVQVVNAAGIQVGHIPRQVAAKIAYLMDTKVITVEGRMIGQNLDRARHYKLGMDMSIYARPSHREALEPELAWATPGGLGFDHMRRLQAQGEIGGTGVAGSQKGKGKGRILGTGMGGGRPGIAGNDEDMRRLLDSLRMVEQDQKSAEGVMAALTSDIDVAKLPLHPSPPGLANGQLLVDLLPHQSQALQWMIERENPKLPETSEDPAVQFWAKQKDKTGSSYWLNVATRTPQSENPVLGSGGIIADGMGLGKTLSCLALVVSTLRDRPKNGSNATLIVTPLSVLSNWEKQIRDHVSPGKLTSYTYHGASKGVTAATLSEYDIVITTYQTVASEAPSDTFSQTPVKGKRSKTAGGPLFRIPFKRIVADEGHVLKNPRAKMTQAFAALRADCRWIATGTPIVNHINDLGSLITCLQICSPLDQPAYFKSLLLRPLKNGDPAAAKLLQALVGQILLRRTKDSKDKDGKRLVELPPVEFFQVPVVLDNTTRALYDEIQEASRKRFEEAMETGELQSSANVLAMLTRLRQLCLDSALIPRSFIDDLRQPPLPEGASGPSVAVVKLSAEKRAELVEKLRQALADSEECSICFDTFAEPRITDCGHCLCELHKKCPMCRHAITVGSLLELPADEDEWEEPDVHTKSVRSAKIQELVKYLKAFNCGDKTLVFSQYTGFLDRVASVLREEGIQFCRFDGGMSAKRRQEVIQLFQTPISPKHDRGNPRVMLISLTSGAVGLNLTAASNVFLCDPWWQSGIEAQAVDRAHRLGQKRTVRVFQLIAVGAHVLGEASRAEKQKENTIEAKVLEIQKRKDALIAKAFEKSSKETKQDKKQARFEELKEIFGMR